jgi:hypothetical protein
VRGQLPDARVTVVDDQRNVVAVGLAKDTEDLFKLGAGVNLQPGQQLWAEQETVDDKSERSPDAVTVLARPTTADLALLHTPVPLYECGRCIWLGGAFPGATVSLTVGHQPPLSVEATAASAKITLPGGAPAFNPTTPMTASQTACGVQGASVQLPEPLPLSGADWAGHAPTVAPPVKCQRAIKLDGLLPGATVVIDRSEEPGPFKACFALPSGWFWFGSELRAREKLSVHQEFDCESVHGVIGDTAYATVADSVPPPPRLAHPICRGDRQITVTGTIAGAVLEFVADGSSFCRAGAVGGTQRVAMPKLAGITRLSVRQTVCRGGGVIQSDESNVVRVRPYAEPSTSPNVVEPVFDGGAAVGVEKLVAGATARIISANRGGRIGEAVANGDAIVDIPLELPLVAGDLLRLEVVNCGRAGSIVPFTRVNPRPDLVTPLLEDPSDDVGGVVLVRNVTPGAIVDIGREGPTSGFVIPVGSVAATAATSSVPISPLLPGERINARQRMPGDVSHTTPFAKLDPRGLSYEPGSTFRISQLIGDSDPTGHPHPVNTSPLGVGGTDLGFPVEHNGNLWLFFGDSGGTDKTEADADPIAWVEAEDPDDAPILHFVLDSQTGEFRRLRVPELGDLGNFEVPTGGFSYDEKLYLFVTKYKTEDLPPDHPRSRMNRSYLAVGDDPHHDFHHVYDISSTVPGEEWAGGPWLIQVSPSVINNADWPDLPKDSGDGLLMYAVGPYNDWHTSDVRLAWAPLTPGQHPPPPEDWLFLSDSSPRWQTLADLTIGNAKPKELLDLRPGDERMRLQELTVSWSPVLRRWVMMYLTGLVRTARLPTGPWFAPEVVFAAGDPTRNADCQQGDWCNYTYAPCFIPRWTRFDRSIRKATVYYNLSIIPPYYKVMLLRSNLLGQ